jgi:phosphatidylglycerophosphatase C
VAAPVTVDSLLAALDRIEPATLPTDVARVAVFDADGTLWRGDIGDVAFERAADAGLIADATWGGPLVAWAASWGVTLPAEKRAGTRRIVELAAARPFDDHAFKQSLYDMQAWIYAGARRPQLEAFAEAIFIEGFEAGIFADMRRLVAALAARGVEVLVASASHGALVVPGARRLGIDRSFVLGTEPAVDEVGVALPAAGVSMYGPRKAAAVSLRLEGRRPLLAFGDSILTTDKELLALAHLPVAVAPRGAHAEAARAHPTLRVLPLDAVEHPKTP